MLARVVAVFQIFFRCLELMLDLLKRNSNDCAMWSCNQNDRNCSMLAANGFEGCSHFGMLVIVMIVLLCDCFVPLWFFCRVVGRGNNTVSLFAKLACPHISARAEAAISKTFSALQSSLNYLLFQITLLGTSIREIHAYKPISQLFNYRPH
jgi:hypothetical protein